MSVEDAVKDLDHLYDENKHQEAVDNIKDKYSKDPYVTAEVLWRNSRSLRALANFTKDKEEYKKLIYEGLKSSKKGLALDTDNSGCNKWYAFHLDLTGRLEGIKKRIENSFDVKKHLQIASDKSPVPDAGISHALGVWCYEVTALSWINRKLASTFFATPPTSTFEEALKNFLEAEKISPGFYAPNYLYLAKTYDQLKNKSEAKSYLEKCVAFVGTDNDTVNSIEEAKGLLKKL